MLNSTKFNTIIYYLSSLIFILGIIMIIPLLLAFIWQEGTDIYQAYLLPIFISFILFFICKKVIITKNLYLDLSTAMLLCTLGWFFASLLGAIPFIIGLDKTFIDALFEAVSGFTTTGITVFSGLDQMPRSILLWRSLQQLLGGLGILTFFLLISSRTRGEVWQLFSAESHKINVARPVPNIFKTVKILWAIYLGFIFLEIIILLLLGLTPFDAITHSFSSLSTGGFSTHDASILYFQNAGYKNYQLIEYVIIVFMLIGGINFLLHFRFFNGNIKGYFEDTEFKTFIYLILAASGLIIIAILFNNIGHFNSFPDLFRKTIFQVVSIITTTGFGTHDINSAFSPAMAKQILLILMLIGGCVGSTSGGVKVLRINILTGLFRREIKKIYLPKRAVIPVTIDKQIIDQEEINKIVAIFMSWLILIFVGAMITAIASDLNAWQSFSGMFSAVGNIGPFYFSVDKMASLAPIIKLTYIIGMLAGRLEILPVILIFTKKSWN